MKDIVQNIVKEHYGFTPVKGDIHIGAEVDMDDGSKARVVKVGTKVLYIAFTVIGELVGTDD